MGYTLALVDDAPFSEERRDVVLAEATGAVGELSEVCGCRPPEVDEDPAQGADLVLVNINGPDPRTAYRELVALARRLGLALLDRQTDSRVDLESPGDLPAQFSGESERVTPPRLVSAEEIARRLRGQTPPS